MLLIDVEMFDQRHIHVKESRSAKCVASTSANLACLGIGKSFDFIFREPIHAIGSAQHPSDAAVAGVVCEAESGGGSRAAPGQVGYDLAALPQHQQADIPAPD